MECQKESRNVPLIDYRLFVIDPKCFTTAWLETQRRVMGCRNPILLEKAILALELVGRLQEEGLPFQLPK
jgi:hypothetical protein